MSNAARIARHRANWARSLDTTCVITHTPLVSDGAGGYTEGVPTTATVACRVQPARTGQEALVGQRVAGLTYWDVQLPHDAVVEPPDTITSGGYVYQVQDATMGRSLRYGITAACVRIAGQS